MFGRDLPPLRCVKIFIPSIVRFTPDLYSNQTLMTIKMTENGSVRKTDRVAEKIEKFSQTFFFAWNTKWRGVKSKNTIHQSILEQQEVCVLLC